MFEVTSDIKLMEAAKWIWKKWGK